MNSGKVWGLDVSKDYIIAYDGQKFYKFLLEEIDKFIDLVGANDIVVLEQTGIYSLPWILGLTKKGVKVFIAHTTALKELRRFMGYSKNDAKDSELLRKLYLEGKFVYPFDVQKFWLRFYFFNYRRAVKDFNQTVNRLRAFLNLVKPDWAKFKTSKKGLKELKEKLEKRAKYDALYAYTLRLTEKLLLTLEDRKNFEKELHKWVVLHKDYELLKTFPHFSDLIIAGLVSTYWDIENFKPSKEVVYSKDGKVKFRKVKAVDKFRAYLIGGSKRYQSGKMDRNRKYQKRPYILGLLYPVFIQAGKKSSPLYPLWAYVKDHYGLLNGFQRYYKFLGYLLGLVYLSVKHRWDFKQVIEFKAKNVVDAELKKVYNKILGRLGGNA